MTEKTKQPGRVKHDQGLADYLALGADRSLEKLCHWYNKIMLKPPALITLKSWSVKHAWQVKAAAHDARVARQITEKAEDAAVEQGVDHVKALTEVADKALQKVIAGLKAENIKADSAYEMASLVNSALGAIKGVQLLTGKATERFEDAVKDSAPEWMQERLKTAAPTATPSDEIDIPETATQH